MAKSSTQWAHIIYFISINPSLIYYTFYSRFPLAFLAVLASDSQRFSAHSLSQPPSRISIIARRNGRVGCLVADTKDKIIKKTNFSSAINSTHTRASTNNDVAIGTEAIKTSIMCVCLFFVFHLFASVATLSLQHHYWGVVSNASHSQTNILTQK